MVQNMYKNNFVVAVKVNGTAQKELKDSSVIIPFDSEYVIHLRNKHRNRNAVAFVYLDGELITPSGIVVRKNSFVDLERPTDKAVKFKFISLEAPEAIEFGKDVENSDKGMGVIEVRWYLEKELPCLWNVISDSYHHKNYPNMVNPWGPFYYNDRIRGMQIGDQLNADRVQSFYSPFTTPCDFTAPSNSSLNTINLNCSQVPSPVAYDPIQAKDGCTVEGGFSSQKFTSIHMDIEDCYTIIKLVLKGVKTVSKDRVLRDFEYTSEDKRILLEREELIQLELKLIAAKKAKLTAELAELTNS
jgi:hypothetical protein